MRPRWAGILLVVFVAVGIVAYKEHRSGDAVPQAKGLSAQGKANPLRTNVKVILIADLREADTPEDNCAEIIHFVREAAARGIKTEELSPDSDSPILKQYHVRTDPTVLILGGNGHVVSRFEGESRSTVSRIRNRLASLSEARR